MDPGSNTERDDGSRFPATFAAGIVVVLILVAGLILLTRLTRSGTPSADQKLPFGSPEQAYAQQVHFQPGPMSQSSNLLNQEFTYAAGTISNDGPRTLRALSVTFEFRDAFNQVVLRDPQVLIEATADPLKAAQTREFQVTLGSHLPSQWNRQYPAIRITGLVLE
jgi:hypothetical protein